MIVSKMTQTLYFNGQIIPMDDDYNDRAAAVLVKDGVIKAVGELQLLQTIVDEQTKKVDLAGKTMLPGFIDAHSHICDFSDAMGVVALEAATTQAQILTSLQTFIADHHLPAGQWVSGFGYDQNFLAEKSPPTREQLDQAAPNNPVIIAHQSGHMGVANSAALKLLGIDNNTPDPAGGKIGRGRDGQLNGYLEETAFTSSSTKIPRPTRQQQFDQFRQAQQVYLSNGITTAQDGLTRQAQWDLLTALAEANQLILDVVSYIDEKNNPELLTDNRDYLQNYRQHLKIGGYKIFLDGSPQGRTAWMSEPYLPTTDSPADYCGYPIYQDDEVADFFTTALREQVQLLAHCNGDAAAQQMIDCYRCALGSQPQTIRPVMIHAQLVTTQQLPLLRELALIPSFFVAHTYYWGDIHRRNFGDARAMKISPARSALDNDLLFTFHQDAPVIQPKMLETIWCAVNRVSKTGAIIGADERISVYESLKAITINAAYQYFEEKTKGSITPAKVADFVILSDNPLTIEPMKIKDIQVLQTIKSDQVVFDQSQETTDSK